MKSRESVPGERDWKEEIEIAEAEAKAPVDDMKRDLIDFLLKFNAFWMTNGKWQSNSDKQQQRHQQQMRKMKSKERQFPFHDWQYNLIEFDSIQFSFHETIGRLQKKTINGQLEIDQLEIHRVEKR